jgi:hypothetical protein
MLLFSVIVCVGLAVDWALPGAAAAIRITAVPPAKISAGPAIQNRNFESCPRISLGISDQFAVLKSTDSDVMKGTGFCPYMHSATTTWALAPEGIWASLE